MNKQMIFKVSLTLTIILGVTLFVLIFITPLGLLFAIPFVSFLITTIITKIHTNTNKVEHCKPILDYCNEYKTILTKTNLQDYINSFKNKQLYSDNHNMIELTNSAISLYNHHIYITYDEISGLTISSSSSKQYAIKIFLHHLGYVFLDKLCTKSRYTNTITIIEFDIAHISQAKEFFCTIKDIIAYRQHDKEKMKQAFIDKQESKDELFVGDIEDLHLFLKDKNYTIIKLIGSNSEETQAVLRVSEVFDLVTIKYDYENRKFIAYNGYFEKLGSFSRIDKNTTLPENIITNNECYIYAIENGNNDKLYCEIVLLL